MRTIAFTVCMVLCWATFVYKLRDLKPSDYNPSILALLVALAFKATAFLVAIPGFAAAIDHKLGVPNLAALGIHIFGGIIFSSCLFIALLFWYEPPRRAQQRVRVVIAAAGLVSIIMILLWSLAGIKERAVHFLVQNGSRHPLIAIYLFIYITSLIITLALTARLCWKEAKKTKIPWLRRGLRTITSGALIYSVSPLNRLSTFVAGPLGVDPLRWEIVVPICNILGIPLILLGLTMPSWGPRLSNVHNWARDYETHRELYPLWRALHHSVPEIALHAATPTRLRNLRYHIYRQIVEIRDARLALRAYMDPHLAAGAMRRGRAAGLDGDDLAAVIEAAQLKVALRSRLSGSIPALASSTESSGVHGGADISSEIAWLTRVARAYKDSPVVAMIDRMSSQERTDGKL